MKNEIIRVTDCTVYRGRNIYSHKPVIRMVVDIGKYGTIPTKDIPGFHEKLLAGFPGLKTNCCSLGYEGGFLERLNEGTYMGHVLEHTILEMQAMLGYNVSFGKTRVLEEPSLYYMVYQYENEVCGIECGRAAVFLFNCFLKNQAVRVSDFLDYLRKISVEADLGPSTSAIAAEAKKRGIPVTRIGHESLIRLGYGKYGHLVESTLTDQTSCICADISSNKQLTKAILNEHKVPVPEGKTVYSELSAVMAANQIGLPVVVKPIDGNQGKGVSLNLKSEEEIKAAFRNAARSGSGVIVEKFIEGKDFRVLVVGGKVSAAAERRPACVTGDGIHSIRELAAIENRDPNRGEQHEKALTKIRLDSVALAGLKKAGRSMNDIPEKDETVLLRENGNLSTGGTAADRTDVIHPDNAELAVRAAGAVGIDIAGVDFVASDISQSILETGGAIVEVNTAPGIRMHLYPSEGEPRNVAKDIVDHLFPSGYRFPIVSVTGTNGKTTTVRLIRHVLSEIGLTVGMTSTSGTFIGEKCVCRGDNSGPRSAGCLLADKTIDAAVLETARGGIVREGLGYDLADVGVITNVAGDHLGLDGIETMEDLAFVKALVAEAVRKDGFAVLNAEDEMTPMILKRVKAKVILFYRHAERTLQPFPTDCVRVFEENGWIRIRDGQTLRDVVRVFDIPVTCGGRIGCNVENCLATVSALYALKVPISRIANGLKNFTQNPGRFDLFRLNGRGVLLDYGHNRPGFEQVIEACRKLSPGRMIGVVGMPGDREDEAIRSAARLCPQAFERIYVKEDVDLRGRAPREVAGIFYETITGEGFPQDRIYLRKDDLEALQSALADSREGDLILVFYEKLEPLVRYLKSLQAVRIPAKEWTYGLTAPANEEIKL